MGTVSIRTVLQVVNDSDLERTLAKKQDLDQELRIS